MRPIDPNDLSSALMGDSERETPQQLSDALAALRLMAIRLDLKVVGAIVSSAISMIPTTKH